MKNITFNESENKIYPMVVWSFACKNARKNNWETIALDRWRFQRRIDEFGKIINPILNSTHRCYINKDRFFEIKKILRKVLFL